MLCIAHGSNSIEQRNSRNAGAHSLLDAFIHKFCANSLTFCFIGENFSANSAVFYNVWGAGGIYPENKSGSVRLDIEGDKSSRVNCHPQLVTVTDRASPQDGPQ